MVEIKLALIRLLTDILFSIMLVFGFLAGIHYGVLLVGLNFWFMRILFGLVGVAAVLWILQWVRETLIAGMKGCAVYAQVTECESIGEAIKGVKDNFSGAISVAIFNKLIREALDHVKDDLLTADDNPLAPIFKAVVGTTNVGGTTNAESEGNTNAEGTTNAESGETTNSEGTTNSEETTNSQSGSSDGIANSQSGSSEGIAKTKKMVLKMVTKVYDYVDECILGYVFAHPDKSIGRSAIEGFVLFTANSGKVLARVMTTLTIEVIVKVFYWIVFSMVCLKYIRFTLMNLVLCYVFGKMISFILEDAVLEPIMIHGVIDTFKDSVWDNELEGKFSELINLVPALKKIFDKLDGEAEPETANESETTDESETNNEPNTTEQNDNTQMESGETVFQDDFEDLL